MTSLIIPPQSEGQRLDRVLALLYPDWSRSKLTAWLKEGAITLNQQICKPNTTVWGGEEVTLNITPVLEPQSAQAEDIPLDIVFEDEHLLVINKPAGLIVHPGAGNPSGTLLNALLFYDEQLQQLPRAGIVHRLDKDTSGLMIVAKTLAAHTHLIRQMQAREIKRQYAALVYGHVISGGTISTNYGRDPKNRLKMAVTAHGKPAVTEYKVRKHYQFITLLDVFLQTGRTHQIRVHMAHVNHPIVGDPLYYSRSCLRAGMSAVLRETLSGFPRQALHAEHLALDHPILNTPLTFCAPLPYDFQTLLCFLDDEHDQS